MNVFGPRFQAAEDFHPGPIVFAQFQRAGFVTVAHLDEHHRPVAYRLNRVHRHRQRHLPGGLNQIHRDVHAGTPQAFLVGDDYTAGHRPRFLINQRTQIGELAFGFQAQLVRFHGDLLAQMNDVQVLGGYGDVHPHLG